MNLRDDIQEVLDDHLKDKLSIEELDNLLDLLMDTYYDYDRARYIM
jgi:hypothetical protein